MKKNLMKAGLCVLLISLNTAILFAAPFRAWTGSPSPSLLNLPYNPSHLMVKFQPYAAAADRNALLNEIGGWVEWDYDQIGWQLIRFDMGIQYDEMKYYVDRRDIADIQRLLNIAMQTAREKAEALRASSLVDKVEFDYYVQLYETDFIPNDPFFVDVDPVAGITTPQQWSSFDVQLPEAWDITQGSTEIIIAIIDSGTDTDHPDLHNNIARWPSGAVRGYDYVGGKNGTILEIFLPVQQDANPDIHWNDGVDDGWGLPDPSAGDGRDVMGQISSDCDLGVFHGTFTASCASAATNNNLGGAGAGFNVKIMPVRCISPEGGLVEYIFSSVSVLTMGVNWAVENGADIISMSLGLPANLEPAGLHDAVTNAYNHGIPIFAASGNSGANEANVPASWPEVFAVGSFSQAHNRADFSTYGWYMDCLAGGGQIVENNLNTAEWIWGCYVASVCDMNNGGPEAGSHGYSAALGTSAACPQAAGIAGLVLSLAPNLTPNTLYNVLRQTCLDVEAPGWDEEAGYGIIQARNALNLINNPLNLQVTLTPQGSTVIPPGGGTLTYQVQLRNNGSQPVIIDFWTQVTLPSGSTYGPLLMRPGINLNPGQSVTRTMTQSVPGSAPAGNYVFRAIAGFYSGVIKAQGQFNFSKSGVDIPGWIGDWASSGWDEELEATTPATVTPAEVTLEQNAPNPFNPVTTLAFSLPQSTKVTLQVFDVQGRRVASLVDGVMPAGRHKVVFDASHLASGIYLYQIQAGSTQQIGKMMLLK
jgi:subtilisin family serine protease